MNVRPIARDCWAAELDSFSRQHEGWLVSIKTQTPDGSTAIDAHDLPLQGVSQMSPGSNDIAIAVGDADNHLTHDVHEAIALRVDLTADEAERALVIDAKDGSRTSVEFRSPTRVEEVDGLPAPHRE
jgi:Family of unknown function (DUF5335)